MSLPSFDYIFVLQSIQSTLPSFGQCWWTHAHALLLLPLSEVYPILSLKQALHTLNMFQIKHKYQSQRNLHLSTVIKITGNAAVAFWASPALRVQRLQQPILAYFHTQGKQMSEYLNSAKISQRSSSASELDLSVLKLRAFSSNAAYCLKSHHSPHFYSKLLHKC